MTVFFIIHRCENCRWPLCERTCTGLYRNKCHTKPECEILSKIPFDSHLRDDKTNVYNFIVPLRCLLLKTTTEWRILIGMESHNLIRKQITNIWQLNEQTVVRKLRQYFDADEIHTICGILEVNEYRNKNSNDFSTWCVIFINNCRSIASKLPKTILVYELCFRPRILCRTIAYRIRYTRMTTN